MSKRSIVTFNIRCPWVDDGVNTLPHRLGAILDKIDHEQPDVICFQEVIERTADFLSRHLPEYQVIYNGRQKHYNGEGVATAIRRETVELLSTEFFWLSPTPHIPASRFEEQSVCPRITQVITARFRGEKQPFRVYNNHLDHISDKARILGIQQVLKRVADDQEKGATPVYILGDFNANPDSETIAYCDAYEPFPIVNVTKNIGTTFHKFGEKLNGPQIDYIYTDIATAAIPYTIEKWTDEQDGIYLSDHYPISLILE